MATLGLLLALPWFTSHPYTETVPRNSTIPTHFWGRTDGCRVQSFEELCGHSILLGYGVAMAGYGFTLYIPIIFPWFHSIKKGHIYICVGMIGIWLGLFLPMIFPVYSYHSPCWTPTAHLAALHFRLGAPTLGPRRSQDPTTNRIAIVTVFCINIVI